MPPELKASFIKMRLSSIALWNKHAVVTLSNWTNSSFNLRRAVNAKRWKLKASWQHFTTAGEVVQNSVMNKRVTVISKKNFCYARVMDTPKSHKTVLVSMWRKWDNITSSEANLSTLLYKALNALKKHDLALSKLHLKVQPLLKNTPKYHSNQSQLMAPPETVVTETVVSAEQWVLYLHSNRMHLICLH